MGKSYRSLSGPTFSQWLSDLKVQGLLGLFSESFIVKCKRADVFSYYPPLDVVRYLEEHRTLNKWGPGDDRWLARGRRTIHISLFSTRQGQDRH